MLSIQPLEGHSLCPIHVRLSKVFAYELDSSESSPVGIGTPRETVLLSTISQIWRAYRGSHVCMPVNPSQMHLCLFSISPSYMSTYDQYITTYTCTLPRLFQGSMSQFVGQKNQSLGRLSSPTMSDARDKPRMAPSFSPYVGPTPTSSVLLSTGLIHRMVHICLLHPYVHGYVVYNLPPIRYHSSLLSHGTTNVIEDTLKI